MGNREDMRCAQGQLKCSIREVKEDYRRKMKLKLRAEQWEGGVEWNEAYHWLKAEQWSDDRGQCSQKFFHQFDTVAPVSLSPNSSNASSQPIPLSPSWPTLTTHLPPSPTHDIYG
uniref:Uncharacterized protein n=1 Tax=Anguilla anguilla TaxID=7936 RepID=A0A0E9RJ25_ANGAN